jgi:hypothetical protein
MHAVCFGGGEVVIEQTEQVMGQEPVTIKRVYEKIKKVVPCRSQRFNFLKEDDSRFELLMRYLEEKFITMPSSKEDLEALERFCEVENRQVTYELAMKCGAMLARLMKDFKQECAEKKLYQGFPEGKVVYYRDPIFPG